MAHTGVPVLLLFLGLVTSTVFVNACDFLNAVGNSSTDFNLTVTPDTLSDKTNYTVRLAGSGNVTVILQAVSASASVGTWSAGNENCTGSPLFRNPFETQAFFEAQWTSSENVSSVTITAHINTTSGIFIVYKTLSQVTTTTTTPTTPTTPTTTAPNTGNTTANSITSSTVTPAPNTGNTTANSITSSTVTPAPNTGNTTLATVTTGPQTSNTTSSSTNSTTVTPASSTTVKPTSATSAVQTSYLTVAFIQILVMLSITSNYVL